MRACTKFQVYLSSVRKKCVCFGQRIFCARRYRFRYKRIIDALGRSVPTSSGWIKNGFAADLARYVFYFCRKRYFRVFKAIQKRYFLDTRPRDWNKRDTFNVNDPISGLVKSHSGCVCGKLKDTVLPFRLFLLPAIPFDQLPDRADCHPNGSVGIMYDGIVQSELFSFLICHDKEAG